MNLNELKYAATHEWALVNGDTATVGITDFAVKTLTDLVFLELPAVGTEVTAGEAFGEVESVKAVSELLAPVSGVVTDSNAAAASDPACLSEDSYDKGWLIKIKMSDPAQVNALLDRAAYEKQCQAEEQH